MRKPCSTITRSSEPLPGERKSALTTMLSLGALLLGTPLLAANLTVTVGNVQSDAGKLYVAVWQEHNWLRDEPTAEHALVVAEALADGAITMQLELDAGEYAITVYQDVNGNGEMDSNFMRMPKEPYGFSNDAVPRFGPPKFRDSAFTVDESGTAISLQLKG